MYFTERGGIQSWEISKTCPPVPPRWVSRLRPGGLRAEEVLEGFDPGQGGSLLTSLNILNQDPPPLTPTLEPPPGKGGKARRFVTSENLVATLEPCPSPMTLPTTRLRAGGSSQSILTANEGRIWRSGGFPPL